MHCACAGARDVLGVGENVLHPLGALRAVLPAILKVVRQRPHLRREARKFQFLQGN